MLLETTLMTLISDEAMSDDQLHNKVDTTNRCEALKEIMPLYYV